MKEVASQRQQEEEAFYRQQELMIDAENQRRRVIGQEEQKLVDQRSRFVQKEKSDLGETLVQYVNSHYRIIVLCSWTRHFTLTVPLCAQVYKWVPLIC